MGQTYRRIWQKTVIVSSWWEMLFDPDLKMIKWGTDGHGHDMTIMAIVMGMRMATTVS